MIARAYFARIRCMDWIFCQSEYFNEISESSSSVLILSVAKVNCLCRYSNSSASLADCAGESFLGKGGSGLFPRKTLPCCIEIVWSGSRLAGKS